MTDIKKNTHPKNRLGEGPTEYYKEHPVVTGDAQTIDNITNHVLGDACTPGNPRACTFDNVRPVVDHSYNGDLDDLLT